MLRPLAKQKKTQNIIKWHNEEMIGCIFGGEKGEKESSCEETLTESSLSK